MTTERFALSYTEAGHGDPVLLLDWTPWDTTALRDSLASRYRVISVRPPEGAAGVGTVEDTAKAVIRLTESLGLDSCPLTGVSLGANVALHVSLARPASVSALVLVSPDCVEPAAPLPRSTPELAVAAMLAHPGSPGQPEPEPRRTAALAALAEQWQTADADAGHLLPELSCATLVVFGQEDRLVSRRAGGVWKEQVPNCSISYVYDAGHAVAVDRADALVNVVLDFVERRETFVVENRASLINP